MMSDAPTPNLTPEEFLKNYRRVADAKRDMDKVADELKSARGVYRSALKAAKKIGVNQAMLIQAMQIVTVQDEAEVTIDFRDLGRYLRYLNSPIGAQFGLFDDGQVEVSADARAQHDEWEANEAGYRAAMAGIPADQCPFPLGSEAAQVWSLGHSKASKVLADVQAGNPGEPVKRRGRKSNGNADIVSGAPA
jgi:ribosome modulation factor